MRVFAAPRDHVFLRHYPLFGWLFLVLLVCSGAAPPAFAVTYYVSPDGDDGNAGTETQPFRTLEKARSVVRTINSAMTEDITVYFRAGTYWLSTTVVFDQNDSGADGFNIIYRSYPGERPIISGGQQITGWTAVGNGT